MGRSAANDNTRMSSDTRAIGRLGEDAACQWLQNQGYRIVGRNVYAAGCEADILAEDDNYFVFVEVKSRKQFKNTPDRYGRPARAVTHKKQEHMLTMAKAYLKAHPEILENRTPRLDVIEVYLSPVTADSGEPTILAVEHLPGAVRQRTDYTRYGHMD